MTGKLRLFHCTTITRSLPTITILKRLFKNFLNGNVRLQIYGYLSIE